MSADIKDIVGETVGQEFKTDEDALAYIKANKDNSSYVGKYKNYGSLIDALETKLGGQENLKKFLESQSTGTAGTNSDSVPREVYETDMFFRDHPEFQAPELKETILSMRKSSGKSYAEIVGSESFKSLYGTYKAGKDAESSKSVLETNPRLGAAANKITEAREAQKSGNQSAAEAAALDAVMPIVKGE